MTDDEIKRNVRVMREMFPAYIDHYEIAAKGGNLERWAAAFKSTIDLVSYEYESPVANRKEGK